MAQKRPDHHVVKNAHVLERGRDLKGAADASAGMRLGRGIREIGAREHDAPFVRRHISSDAVEERGFASAVWADEPDDLTFACREIGPGQGVKASERYGDIFRPKQHDAASAA